MRDNSVRRFIKFIARIRYSIDLKITRRILKFRGIPQFVLAGHCIACGQCCQTPSIHTPFLSHYFKSFRWLTLLWHHQINGFIFLSENRPHRILTFNCSHFNPSTQHCDSYESRPGLCRDYPHNLLFSVHPEFFPNCGFRPVDQHAQHFKELLDAHKIPQDIQDVLRSKLHLD